MAARSKESGNSEDSSSKQECPVTGHKLKDAEERCPVIGNNAGLTEEVDPRNMVNGLIRVWAGDNNVL